MNTFEAVWRDAFSFAVTGREIITTAESFEELAERLEDEHTPPNTFLILGTFTGNWETSAL